MQNYNQYLKFGGQSGLYVQDSIQQLSLYTMSIWIRLQQNPLDAGRSLSILTLKPGFQCYFNVRSRIQCVTDVISTPSQYQIEAGIRKYNWYILSIRSKASSSLIQLRELSNVIFSYDSQNKFFPFGYSNLQFTEVFLGIESDKRSNGFIGNLRNFKLFADYYDDATVYRTQFIYIFPFYNMIMQIMMNDVNDFRNDADKSVGQIVGSYAQLPKEIDYKGTIWCWFPQDIYPSFVEFSSNFKLSTYNIPTTLFSTTTNFNTTFQAWFQRSNTATIDFTNGQDEILFEHTNSVKVRFMLSDYNNIRVDSLNYNNRQATAPVAFNRWYFIQVISTPGWYSLQLYESDGQVVSSQNITTPALKVSSRTITIGQYFNGAIQAVKYYKTSNAPIRTIYAMKQEYDISTDCLLFFWFNQAGINSQDNKFINLAQVAKTFSLGSDNALTFKDHFIREYGSTDVFGTINQTLNFDGYTCKDNKEKLYMIDATSYSNSIFTLTSNLQAYTVEFWVKPTATVQDDAYFFAIQEVRFNEILTAIIQSGSKKLNCYVQFTKNATQKVNYLDYQNDIKKWMHIACIVDISNSIVQGVLYDSVSDYVYYEPITSNVFLPNQDYKIFINTDPRKLSNGVPGSYYSEVRLWSYARSTQQVKNYQFHQLDVVRERPGLVAYFKMMSAEAVYKVGELDYSVASLNKYIGFNNVRWQQNTDLTICPLGMYKGSITDLNCYREGILKLQLFVDKNSTHYIVTPFYTQFRNTLLRNDALQLFDYTWSLDKVDAQNSTNQAVFKNYLTPQINQPDLVFSMDQVSDKPGKYDFTLILQDKMNSMEQAKASITLKTSKCLIIIDKDTKQSVVYKDMDSKRSVDNAVFYYDYSQCGLYTFDQSSMTFDIDYSDKISFSSNDHNKDQKTFTLRANVQQYLPLNEYFYFRMKGVWRNQNDKSDIIEYQLIYACRYISKLVAKLKPDYYTILKGQQLVIDYDAQYYNIIDSVSSTRAYTTQWQCPGELDVYCRSQGNQLRITYNMYADSKMPFWTAQTIKLIATTNFIQGDGTKTSTSQLQISWLDVNPDAIAQRSSKLVNKEQRLAYQLNINNMAENQLQIKWLSNPVIASSCYLNQDNRKQFVVNSTCLTEGVNYNLTANIIYNEQNQVIWSSSNLIQMPVSPKGGSISCNRTTGKAYIDYFSCSANGWVISNAPARYQFFISDITTNVLVPVSGLSTSINFITPLPPTKKITVKVMDDGQGITYSSIAVTVTYAYEASIITRSQSLLSTANQNLKNLNLQTINNLVVLSATVNSLGNVITPIGTFSIQDYHQNISQMIYQQALNLKSFSDEQTRRSFIQGSVSTFTSLTQNLKQMNKTNANIMLDSLILMMNGSYTDSTDYLIYDTNFQTQYLSVFENLFNALKIQLSVGNITNSIMDTPPAQDVGLSNITVKARSLIGIHEQYISTKIYENQVYYQNNSAFSFQTQKFSRMAQNMQDQSQDYSDGMYTSYSYPLQDATQPSPRQSFSVINFKVSPFIGDYFLNQSATSQSSIYFAYRDENGNYLSGENILRRINMTYKYEYSPLIFLPNVTTCGYIGLEDSYWENKSCIVEFSRKYSNITCHCKHMSYYSIIDDYLVRPQKVPLVYLTFRNWTSFIVFLYIALLLVIGTIYTYGKDHQDFRYLHDQEELQGNTLSSENALTLISLTFKRKVFFMMFADKYKFSNLLKIYLMLLHPVFQLKYRMDPETPRFARFLMLYTRIMILFGISFFALKDVKNLEELSNDPDYSIIVFEVFIFIILASFLLVPMPIILICCCRSRYLLIDPKGQSREASDIELDEPNGIRDAKSMEPRRDRISDVMIDTNIPIKLLFLINAFKVEEIMKEYNGKLSYATGELNEVGKRLYELDIDIQAELAQKAKAKKAETNQAKKDIKTKQTNNDFESHTSTNLKGNPQSRKQNFDQPQNHQYVNNQRVNQPENSQQSERDQNVMEEPDSNRPLRFSSNKSRHRSYDTQANKTEQHILDPNNIDMQINEESYEVENLDDDDYEQNKIRDLMHEGGDHEGPHRSQNNSNRNNHQQNKEEEEEEEEELSDQDSIDTQLFTDEKKELIEDKNVIGINFGRILAAVINLGIFIAVMASYVTGNYYNIRNQYVWVVVFFGAQIFSFFVSDMLVLLIMALCVSKCFRNKKVCLTKWMRESLYIYEDYKYVVQFANTRIT